MSDGDFLLRRAEGVAVKVHPEVYKRMTEYCLRNGFVRNAAVSIAVHEWLEKREPKEE